MYSTFELIVGCCLTSFITAALIETMHFLENRKKKEVK